MDTLKAMEENDINKRNNEQKYVLVSKVNQYDPIWEDCLYTEEELNSKQVQNHCRTATFLYFNLGQPKKIGIHHPFTTLDVMSINPKLLALDNYPQVDNAEFYFTKEQVKQIRKAFKVNDEHDSNIDISGKIPYDNNGINFSHNISVFFNTNPIAVPAKLIDKIPMQAIRDIGISEGGVYDGLDGGEIPIFDDIPGDIKYDQSLLKDIKNNYNVFNFNEAFTNSNVVHYALNNWSHGKRVYSEIKKDVLDDPESDNTDFNPDDVNDLDFAISTSISDDNMALDKMEFEDSKFNNYDKFRKYTYHKLWSEHNKRYLTSRLDLKKHLPELKPYIMKPLQKEIKEEQQILYKYRHVNVPTEKKYQKYAPIFESKFLTAVAKIHNEIGTKITLGTPYTLITDAHIPNTNHKKHQFRVIEGFKNGKLITKHVPLSNHKKLAQQHLFTPAEITQLRQEMYASDKYDYRHLAFVTVPVSDVDLITPNRLKFILKDESNRVVFNFVESDEITVKEWMQQYSEPFTMYQVVRNYAELHEHITTKDLANLPNADESKYGYSNV